MSIKMGVFAYGYSKCYKAFMKFRVATGKYQRYLELPDIERDAERRREQDLGADAEENR